MEGTLAPRGLGAPDDAEFREQADGAELALGRPRFIRRGAVGAISFLLLGSLMLLLVALYGSNMNPGGALGIASSAVLFFAFAALFVPFVVLNRGLWVLQADERGIRLLRAHRRPRDLAWEEIQWVRYGPMAIATGRNGSRLGDALSVKPRGRGGLLFVDTVRFAVAADDVDRMSAVQKRLGQRHGVPVEPFPMAGRGGSP